MSTLAVSAADSILTSLPFECFLHLTRTYGEEGALLKVEDMCKDYLDNLFSVVTDELVDLYHEDEEKRLTQLALKDQYESNYIGESL